MSPEDKTTYSTGHTPVKVLRPSSPVRARVFPPRQEARVYKGFYSESPHVQYSPIRPRVDTRPDCPDPFMTRRRGMAKPKPLRTKRSSAPHHEIASRQLQSTLYTIQDTVKTAVDCLVQALSRSHHPVITSYEPSSFKIQSWCGLEDIQG